MHTWGDEGVDWEGISNAAEFIGTNLRKWGRVGVTDYKEKYGSVRVYCHFGWHQLFSITHPGYVYSRYPKWFWSLDCLYISKLIRPLNRLIVPYQTWLYKYLYRKAVQKWPHLRLEILSGADYDELLAHLGVHRIRTSQNSYKIAIDWAPEDSRENTTTTIEEGE